MNNASRAVPLTRHQLEINVATLWEEREKLAARCAELEASAVRLATDLVAARVQRTGAEERERLAEARARAKVEGVDELKLRAVEAEERRAAALAEAESVAGRERALREALVKVVKYKDMGGGVVGKIAAEALGIRD